MTRPDSLPLLPPFRVYNLVFFGFPEVFATFGQKQKKPKNQNDKTQLSAITPTPWGVQSCFFPFKRSLTPSKTVFQSKLFVFFNGVYILSTRKVHSKDKSYPLQDRFSKKKRWKIQVHCTKTSSDIFFKDLGHWKGFEGSLCQVILWRSWHNLPFG